MAQRFLSLADVAEVLNISPHQTRALLTSGELPAIQLGGRGIWRIEVTELEAYIERLYAQSRARAAGEVPPPRTEANPAEQDESDPADHEG